MLLSFIFYIILGRVHVKLINSERERDMEKMKYLNLKKALLVIDVQEDYTGTTAKSPFPYKNSEKLINNINKLIDEAKRRNMLVVYIKQEFEGIMGKKYQGYSVIILQ